MLILQEVWEDTTQWSVVGAFSLWSLVSLPEIRMQEMVSMGVGNKPFLDIKPSEAAIHDRAIDYIMKGRGKSSSTSLLPPPHPLLLCPLGALMLECVAVWQEQGPGLPSPCLSLTTPIPTRDHHPLCLLVAPLPARCLGLSTCTCTWIRPYCQAGPSTLMLALRRMRWRMRPAASLQ